jgi:crotonobetainyl-CoA:carnitine CoA-transferase CaiB-like acyl-CoA transferase
MQARIVSSPACLDGITVLDFSSVGPAARCARTLTDCGANAAREERVDRNA